MTRGISASTLAALETDAVSPIYFVQLGPFQDTSPETYDRFHSWLGTISWGGNDWVGAGEFGTIETLRESTGLSPRPLKLTLSGLSSEMTDLVFNTNYYRRPCLMYLGAMSSGALVEDPSLIYSGFIESLDMVLGGEGGDTVSLVAESELILFKRSRNIRYTNNQLQSEYSGDLGLEYKAQVATQKVTWRGKTNQLGSSGTGSSSDGGFNEQISR